MFITTTPGPRPPAPLPQQAQGQETTFSSELRGASNRPSHHVLASARDAFRSLGAAIRNAFVSGSPSGADISTGRQPSVQSESPASASDNLHVRRDVHHAYRLDSRSPAELGPGFSAYARSALGPLHSVLPAGSAFCAGECLGTSLANGKQQITPSQVAAELGSVVLNGAAKTHIYYLALEGIPVARYLDNISVATLGPDGVPMHFAGNGPLNILRTATNMEEWHSDSDIEFRQFGSKFYDFPFRAHTRAQAGELAVLESVPKSRLLYGGPADAPHDSWTPLT
jgi:hypothetical protein